ncbi:DUF1758 domain-containing protein [Trichonephila clavipes]|nr:DUF1758 domain-containing protein [Trichonephila clavipes]
MSGIPSLPSKHLGGKERGGNSSQSVVSDNNFYNTPKNCFLTKNLDILDKTLKRFWEIEEVETTEVYSDELKYCNDHFLRVVFNASAKTSSGLSLNDLLCKGGVIQEDLFSILIRFRKYAYAFPADIRHMFRTIEVNPSQTKLKKILWKNSTIAPTKVYELKTVTYGTASTPYLATRVLQQLALDEEKDFPLASEVLLQDFYIDDCLSGASELSEFEKLKSELMQLLQRGGMTLHKWCSNKAPSTELREFSLDRSSEEVMVKTLGMLWDS